MHLGNVLENYDIKYSINFAKKDRLLVTLIILFASLRKTNI